MFYQILQHASNVPHSHCPPAPMYPVPIFLVPTVPLFPSPNDPRPYCIFSPVSMIRGLTVALFQSLCSSSLIHICSPPLHFHPNCTSVPQSLSSPPLLYLCTPALIFAVPMFPKPYFSSPIYPFYNVPLFPVSILIHSYIPHPCCTCVPQWQRYFCSPVPHLYCIFIS